MQETRNPTAGNAASRPGPWGRRTAAGPPASHRHGASCAGPGFYVWDEERRRALVWALELWSVTRARESGGAQT
jgi:hypothetical protein